MQAVGTGRTVGTVRTTACKGNGARRLGGQSAGASCSFVVLGIEFLGIAPLRMQRLLILPCVCCICCVCWLRFWRLQFARRLFSRDVTAATAAAHDYYYPLLLLLSNVIKLCIHLLTKSCADHTHTHTHAYHDYHRCWHQIPRFPPPRNVHRRHAPRPDRRRVPIPDQVHQIYSHRRDRVYG